MVWGCRALQNLHVISNTLKLRSKLHRPHHRFHHLIRLHKILQDIDCMIKNIFICCKINLESNMPYIFELCCFFSYFYWWEHEYFTHTNGVRWLENRMYFHLCLNVNPEKLAWCYFAPSSGMQYRDKLNQIRHVCHFKHRVDKYVMTFARGWWSRVSLWQAFVCDAV